MNIPAKPWTGKQLPRRILVIRLQAMGDVVITLPYLQHLRNTLPPATRIDFLTREETAPIPKNIVLFDKVLAIGGGRNYKKIMLHTLLLLPKLLLQRYDVVIDLQNNIYSDIVRKTLWPKAWCVFDRFSPVAAGERNRLTIEAAGLGVNQMNTPLRLKDENAGAAILKANGWNGTDKLVVFNPAGFVVTRNWPMTSYAAFAQLWLQQFPATRFLLLGTSFIAEKATFLEQALGNRVISLVGKTTPVEAFAVLQHATVVLSEDSGLMHMSWVSGVPTLTLFGSTRSDWSRPLGDHSLFLDSSDLACGNCMQSVCKFGDVRCLTRYTPEQVVSYGVALIQKKTGNK
jgi:ADP-heptose:LPS heptosyltransferase